MKNKSFLIPLSAALASLYGDASAVATNIEKQQAQKSASQADSELRKLLHAGDKLATYPVAGELHALILRKSVDGVTLAEHYSHRSHSSHSSHRSHYSSR
jgi:hypothetical protein